MCVGGGGRDRFLMRKAAISEKATDEMHITSHISYRRSSVLVFTETRETAG